MAGTALPALGVEAISRSMRFARRRVAGATTMLTVLAPPLPAFALAPVRLLDQLQDELPRMDAELDVAVEEVHAQRLAIQALMSQLTALDTQLGVLEGALAPLQAWAHRWAQVRDSVAQVIAQLEQPGLTDDTGATDDV